MAVETATSGYGTSFGLVPPLIPSMMPIPGVVDTPATVGEPSQEESQGASFTQSSPQVETLDKVTEWIATNGNYNEYATSSNSSCNNEDSVSINTEITEFFSINGNADIENSNENIDFITNSVEQEPDFDTVSLSNNSYIVKTDSKRGSVDSFWKVPTALDSNFPKMSKTSEYADSAEELDNDCLEALNKIYPTQSIPESEPSIPEGVPSIPEGIGNTTTTKVSLTECHGIQITNYQNITAPTYKPKPFDFTKPKHPPLKSTTSTPIPGVRPDDLGIRPASYDGLNSSDITASPGIVINYHYSNPKNGSDQMIIPEAIKSPSKDIIESVHNYLITSYLNERRIALLPWLEGFQSFPLEDLFIEPQVTHISNGRAAQDIDLIKTLQSPGQENRLVLEGEPGMGKTLLAMKLTLDWAKKTHLKNFKFVFHIRLGDFKGELKQYVKEELLPTYFGDRFDEVWRYCEHNDEKVLFILDGYDELMKDNRGDVTKLLRQNFPNSKVLITSRPDGLQYHPNLKKFVVKGFTEIQVLEFISKYFKIIKQEDCGRSLKSRIENDQRLHNLARRPLFCVLLCMLYDTEGGKNLPEKFSDMIWKIMLCLIKINERRQGNDDDIDSFPPIYERLFLQFGKLCFEALQKDQTRFTKEEIINSVGDENLSLLEKLGFMFTDKVKQDTNLKKFWLPVHKTFLEYLAAFYISKHIENECKSCTDCKNFPSLVFKEWDVLKFVVSTLGEKAHLLLDNKRFSFFQKMKKYDLLVLLREAGASSQNARSVAKLLDSEHASITTCEVDFEGWSKILPENLKKLKSLEIVWRIKSQNPDQETSFVEAGASLYQAFFSALHNNTSIKKLTIRAMQDGEPFSDEKITLFFSHLQSALQKENLEHLEIKDMRMEASGPLKKAISTVSNMDKRALESLETLILDVTLEDNDLKDLCDALQRCAHKLKRLKLMGLKFGYSGFSSLIGLLKDNKNIQNLHLSMDRTDFMPTFEGSKSEDNRRYDPAAMLRDLKRVPREANKNNNEAYRQRHRMERSQSRGRPPDPTVELKYLMQDPLCPKVKDNISLKRYWSINGGRDLEPSQEKDGASNTFTTRVQEGNCRIPLPLCLGREQHKSLFHDLFRSLPDTGVKDLTFSNAYTGWMSVDDMVCLGEAIRKSSRLTSLNIKGLKADHYIPVLLALGQSKSITNVNLQSNSVKIKDMAFQMATIALKHNTSLTTLNLNEWQFLIEDKSKAFECISQLLDVWKVTKLSLENTNIELGFGTLTTDAMSPILFKPPIVNPIRGPALTWLELKELSLKGMKLKEYSGLEKKGNLLLSDIRNLTNLTSLDLALSNCQQLVSSVDDEAAIKFFNLCGENLKKLQSLSLDNWTFKFSKYEETCASIGRLMSNRKTSLTHLKKLKLYNVNEVRPDNLNISCGNTLLHHLVSNLKRLEELDLCYYSINGNKKMDEVASRRLGKCFHDHWGGSHKQFTLLFYGLADDAKKALCEELKRPPYRVISLAGHPIRITVQRHLCFLG